jgi:hypothetical protein
MKRPRDTSVVTTRPRLLARAALAPVRGGLRTIAVAASEDNGSNNNGNPQ